ncbi:hypothetical protein E1B28_008324 [Marasmius oreades]|uniref:F-box domain-containing protein n=1 Tax=Marasmius oreades TaxID=181124 RepID=A0A9P7RYB2_9AGAR|nr:uncharacterized protein E1B28_008324 [Marasmius oreades]KAG7091932.1 hypothetical protein E1B28_008324 [Marasmius oreades]
MFSTSTSWTSLPQEMKLAVIESLSLQDTRALSLVDRSTYNACLPVTFKDVKIDGYSALLNFLQNVPRNYLSYIRTLQLSTQSQQPTSFHLITEQVTSLLISCPCMEDLTLRLAGSLHHTLVSCFSLLSDLKNLTICNTAMEDISPLSERFVVFIAASVPNLQTLTLDRISRSKLHATDLNTVFPYVPLVFDDADIPNHPILGSNLYLPSLLRIPTLRELTIRETHLGDPRWATVPVACRLEVLDLGSCYHENEDFNRVCIERIMAAVGRTVDVFSLETAVSDTVFAKPSVTPMQRLRKLHISPFFPVDNVVDTMSNLAGSPIESLSMQCFEDDVVDMCTALEEFLSLRVERGPDFYGKLSRIDVAVTAQDGVPPTVDDDAEAIDERLRATKRLQEFCHDLRLASYFKNAVPLLTGPSRGRSSSFSVEPRWPSIQSVADGRGRSMTI